MANNEANCVLEQVVDGELVTLYPVTKAECVQGLSERIGTEIQPTVQELQTNINTKADSSALSTTDSRVANLQQQVNNIASLPEGSTTGDAELVQARVGVDGTNYANLKTRLDTEMSDVKEDLSGFKSYILNTDNLLASVKIVPNKYYTNGVEYDSNDFSYAIVPLKSGTIYQISRARFIALRTGSAIAESVDYGYEYTPTSDAELYVSFWNNLGTYGGWIVCEKSIGINNVSSYQTPALNENMTAHELGNKQIPISQKCVTEELGKISDNSSISQDDIEINAGYFTSTTLQYWGSTARVAIAFPCKANHTYNITKNIGDEYAVGTVADKPTKNITQSVNQYVSPNYTTGTVRYTPNIDGYIIVMCALSYTTYPFDEVKSNISILEFTGAKDNVARDNISKINQQIDEKIDKILSDVEIPIDMQAGYFTETTLLYWTQTAHRIIYFKCEPNTKYKITRQYGDKFVCVWVEHEPERGVTQPVYGYTDFTTDVTEAEYTVGECGNDGYVLVYVISNTYTEKTQEEVLATIKVTTKGLDSTDKVARTIITFNKAYLPKHLYLIIGKVYEIYHNQICPNAENYSFIWNGGINYGNRVRLRYDTTMDSQLKCTIYNADGTKAIELSTTVHVVNPVSTNISLIPLGDSLTNHCVWESELMNLSDKITCVGTRSRTVNDASGNARLVYDEGRAGFTSFNYISGSPYGEGASDSGGLESPHNNWYDSANSKFSTAYYFANKFPTGQTAPNMMTFFLGMNDNLGAYTVEQIVANIKIMIDDIRTYNANLPIVLMSPQLRYIGNLGSAEHTRFLEFAKSLEELAETYSKVAYLPLSIGMDSENNYNMTNVTINTRSTETEKTASDVTHPAPVGYWQIADYVLGAISYLSTN